MGPPDRGLGYAHDVIDLEFALRGKGGIALLLMALTSG